MHERRTVAAVGGLYILGTVAGISSVLCTRPVMGAADPFSAIAAREPLLAAGALFVLVMGFSLALVPVLLYPILRKENEALAIAYVVFRGALETLTYVALAVCWLALAGASREIARTGAAAGSALRVAGDTLLWTADAWSVMTRFVFSLGALIFYGLLVRSRLLPRWIPIWGLVAILLHLTPGLFQLFSRGAPVPPVIAALDFPIFLQEMVMAVWMILKGFSSPADASARANGASA